MNSQIEEIFSKYKSAFIARQPEIKEFLVKYFEKAFKDQIVEDVQRIDATERIQKAGFQKDISAWRNTYRNIVLSTCIIDNKNNQKRYDYKFLFVEEKLDEATLEIVEKAMDDASRLQRAFNFDEAVAKVDAMIELIQKEEDEVYNKRLNDFRREILAAKDQYEKGMEKISKTEERFKENRKNNKLEEIVNDCEKIIEVADQIKKGDIKRKYSKLLEDTKKEIQALIDIKRIEKSVNLHRANENFEEALKNCEKIIEIAKTTNRKELVAQYAQVKEEIKEQYDSFKEKYEKSYKEIEKLEEEIKNRRDNHDLEPIPKVCEKISEIAKAIKNNEIAKKYSQLSQQTIKEIGQLKEIDRLEKEYNKNIKVKDLEAAISCCIKIVKTADSISRRDLSDKYILLRNELKEKISKEKELIGKIQKEINKLEKLFNEHYEKNEIVEALENCEKLITLAESIDNPELITKYSKLYEEIGKKVEVLETSKLEALKKQEEIIKKTKEIEQIIQIEKNVLPIIEEFSVDDILKDFSGNISESMDKIAALLDDHRVEVKKEILSKSKIKSKSGEVLELEKKIEVKEPEEKELVKVFVQSGLENPFDDVIEEAIITDLIPYNYEITKIELNGKAVDELPDNTLKSEGLELNWQIKNVQPKEKVEINYDMRRRISRTIIFILENQLKIIKTHSNLNPLELEGFFEAKMPFTNSYQTVLDGVIVEDIIPLYYLHFIKEPTHILPAETANSKQGDLIKWNIGAMEKVTLKYHYKLLELYKFEELKILINQWDKEGLGALDNNDLLEALGKYKKVVDLLSDYLK